MAVPYLGEEELEEKVKYYEKRGSEIKTPTILEGLDEALFEKVTVLDGELDPLFDENINAIAIRVETDDYGNVENIERYPKVGDTLTMVYQNMYGIEPGQVNLLILRQRRKSMWRSVRKNQGKWTILCAHLWKSICHDIPL